MADEQCLYRISAAADGRIEKLDQSSTGTHVNKDQGLATYFAPEILNAAQSFGLDSESRLKMAAEKRREWGRESISTPFLN